MDQVPLSSARLRAPVPRPPKFLAIGYNYTAHLEETHMARPSAARADALFVSPPQRRALKLVLRSRADRTASPSQAPRPHAATWARFGEIPPSYEERGQ